MRALTLRWMGVYTQLSIGSHQPQHQPRDILVILTILPERCITELESHLTSVPNAPSLEGVHAGSKEVRVIIERICTFFIECAHKRTTHELAHFAFGRD